MRLYFLDCPKCGWHSNGPVGQEIAEQVAEHRCRICLKLDPNSTQKFRVREVIMGMDSNERRV